MCSTPSSPSHAVPTLAAPMAFEAARLSPSLAVAFLGRRAPPDPPFLRRLPLLLPRRFLRASASASSASSGGDGRAVALPSSELRKRRSSSSATSPPAEDDKLRSLRRLFARPDIAIDAYIVPSQDAHQVHHLPPSMLQIRPRLVRCLLIRPEKNDGNPT